MTAEVCPVGHKQYRLACACGVVGDWRGTAIEASLDRDQHAPAAVGMSSNDHHRQAFASTVEPSE